MDQASFETFVKQQQPLQVGTHSEVEQVSAQDELKEWLGQLNTLYETVQLHLDSYIQAGQIAVEFGTTTLFEEEVGSYEATNMLVRVGRTSIQFEPIGTFLVGMKGRVNVTGPAGSAALALVDKNSHNLASMMRVTSRAIGTHVNVAVEIGPSGKDGPITWVWKLITASARRSFVELDAETVYQLIAELSPA